MRKISFLYPLENKLQFPRRVSTIFYSSNSEMIEFIIFENEQSKTNIQRTSAIELYIMCFEVYIYSWPYLSIALLFRVNPHLSKYSLCKMILTTCYHCTKRMATQSVG